MFDLFTNSPLPVLERVVQFTQARHGVLAGNIANMNTPGYTTRDLSTEAFEENLNQMLAAKGSATSPGEAAVLRSGPGLVTAGDTLREPPALEPSELAGVDESFRGMLRHDEGDVGIEHQVTEIAKNQAKHNLAIALMTTQMRQLRAAISEQVT